MKTAENIKKVALIFFLLIGITHIVSGLMFSNGIMLPLSLIINRSLDIPFAMTAVIYGFSSIYTGLEQKTQKKGRIAFIGISAIIFILLIYVNFFIADKPGISL